MKGTGNEWAGAYSVGAVLIGTWGLLIGPGWLTFLAWAMLIGALGAIITDNITPQLALASCAVGVVFVGLAGTVAGYALDNTALAYGSLAICALGFVVALAEMWGEA